MARTQKIDNSILKRFAREEKKREVEIREQKVYFMLICEGEKTEPHYFNALKNELPKHTLEINIIGTGANTLSLVDRAIKEKYKAQRHYDRIWLVFDKDSFPEDNFDNAIHKATGHNINCAWSNEAFELWYILHFQFVNTPMGREDYKKYLEGEFHKKELTSFSYLKNANNMYQLLQEYGNESFAINNAKKLKEQFQNNQFANHNPCTCVHELVFELRNPLDVLKKINGNHS